MNARFFLLLVLFAGLAGCRSPIAGEGKGGEQARFEQEQAGYPDRLSSRQEAEAAERLRQQEIARKR